MLKDILFFTISEFSNDFVKSVNREDVLFKSQYMLEKSASINKGFTYNTTHDSNNKLTGTVYIISYTRDNFERFGNYFSIDVMKSSVCIAKDFCYIAPVVLNKIGQISCL